MKIIDNQVIEYHQKPGLEGAYVAYRYVWRNIYENYFNICKKLGRLEEFYRLQDSRNEVNKNTKKD